MPQKTLLTLIISTSLWQCKLPESRYKDYFEAKKETLNKETTTCPDLPIFFDSYIQPKIETTCTTCHNNATSNPLKLLTSQPKENAEKLLAAKGGLPEKTLIFVAGDTHPGSSSITKGFMDDFTSWLKKAKTCNDTN